MYKNLFSVKIILPT